MNRAYNNNYSVLPFYTDISMQVRYLTYSYGAIYPLYCPRNMRPCFQILETSGSIPTLSQLSVKLCDKDNNELQSVLFTNDLWVCDLTDMGGGYIIASRGEYDHAANNGQLLPIGTYYIKLTDSLNNKVYYSEFITIINDADSYTKIRWRNLDDLYTDSGIILYTLFGTNTQGQSISATYTNTLYLLTQLGKPEYQFDEEGETRDGHFFPTKQVSYKKYKAVIEATEYLLDAMRLIRLADSVVVTDPYGTEFNADTFLITPQWQEQGDLAVCTIEMTTDTAVKKCGRATAIQ